MGFKWRWNYLRMWICQTKRYVGVVTYAYYGYKWTVYVRSSDDSFLRMVESGHAESPFQARKLATRVMKEHKTAERNEPCHMM